MDDLETYQQRSNRESVLLFPCLPSRLRFLIHKYIEELPELATFSIGESWCRRVVICQSELRGELGEGNDTESSNSVYEEPGRSREGKAGVAKPKNATASRGRGHKRPDKPLYMPRAARKSLPRPGPTTHEEVPSPASGRCGCTGSSSNSCSCHETNENTRPSSTANDESLPGAQSGRVLNRAEDSSACRPLEGKEKLLPRRLEGELLDSEQTVSGFAELTLEEERKDKDDLASGSQIEDICAGTDDVTEEIKAHLREGVLLSIEHVHNDYSVHENVGIDSGEFRHVIEIHDFPSEFKTEDLLEAFTDYSDDGMKITWVDDTHALGIFSSEAAALHALTMCHPLMKTRVLAEGSKKAKSKAFSRAESIQPVKERPRTDCAVAKRMVTRALGLQARGRVPRY